MSVGIDSQGGAVDGARGEVNDARMFQGTWREWRGCCRCEWCRHKHRQCKGCGCEVCRGLRGAWGANTGAESTNSATRDVGVGIDSPGGAVDAARDKVNDAHMGMRSTSKGCTCCGCAALLSLNMES